MLDYHPGFPNGPRPVTWQAERVVMGVMAVVNGLIGLAIFVATVVVWAKTWPSFGMTLLAAPAGLVATAFGSIAVTAAKVALRD